MEHNQFNNNPQRVMNKFIGFPYDYSRKQNLVSESFVFYLLFELLPFTLCILWRTAKH